MAQWFAFLTTLGQVHPPRCGRLGGAQLKTHKDFPLQRRLKEPFGEASVQTPKQINKLKTVSPTLTLIPGKVTAEEA